jgi:hypothetical protein
VELLTKSTVEKKRKTKVYLAYHDDSTSLAEDIERILKENDIPYWEIRKDLAPGRDINDIIHDVMKERTHLVFIYSDRIGLKYVESLVRIARQYDDIIIPVVTTEAALPHFLGGIKPIIYRDYDYSKLWHELLWGIGIDEDLEEIGRDIEDDEDTEEDYRTKSVRDLFSNLDSFISMDFKWKVLLFVIGGISFGIPLIISVFTGISIPDSMQVIEYAIMVIGLLLILASIISIFIQKR